MPQKQETTTVEVKLDTWRALNSQKDPGDSMDDVIRRACGLDELEDDDEEQDAEDSTRARDAIDDALSGWTPGTAGADRQRRREIGRTVLETLRGNGPMSASDFKRELLPAELVDDEKPDSWWDRVALPALNEAKDAGVVEYQHGKHVYEWRGDE